MYANLDIEGFVKAVLLAGITRTLRFARTNGCIDYLCIWNTNTPHCIEIEVIVGRGAQWLADRHWLLPQFEYLIALRHGVNRKHKLSPTKVYGNSK